MENQPSTSSFSSWTDRGHLAKINQAGILQLQLLCKRHPGSLRFCVQLWADYGISHHSYQQATAFGGGFWWWSMQTPGREGTCSCTNTCSWSPVGIRRPLHAMHQSKHLRPFLSPWLWAWCAAVLSSQASQNRSLQIMVCLVFCKKNMKKYEKRMISRMLIKELKKKLPKWNRVTSRNLTAGPTDNE